MAPKPGKLAFIFAIVLFVAAFITINTWTVAAKHEDGWRALSATGTIHRSGLMNVY
jgi:hypothetical protein